MNPLELRVLEACAEVVRRQDEMLPQVAATLQVPADRVFYTWALRRGIKPGKLADASWNYFFHGYECDLRNDRDGRLLRIDFGPGGRVGILNDYGLLRFIMTAVSPWQEFPDLRAHLEAGVPYTDPSSGAYRKLTAIWARLAESGAFQQADPALVALLETFSARGSDGLNYIHFPPEITEEGRVDCLVAHRLQLSPTGQQILAAGGSSHALLIENAASEVRRQSAFT